MFRKLILLGVTPLFGACSTLGESLQLGATLGTVGGAAAVYSAEKSMGGTPTLESVGSGAAIGLGVGLLSSYIVHKSTQDSRASESPLPELYFGDLPPSPFVYPKTLKKGGK